MRGFKWLGHKGMSGERLNKRLYKSEADGRRDSGRPCARWLDRATKEWNKMSLIVAV